MAKPKKIMIASVLKPIDDVRMYERMAWSISKETDWETHILGSCNPIPEKPLDRVVFHPVFNFGRAGWKRLFAPFRAFIEFMRVRPDCLIVNTHELLWAGLWYKLIFRKRLFYDVRENYGLNILHTNAFPKVLRRFLSFSVRLKERLVQPFIEANFMAERCYLEELPFSVTKTALLENKYNPFPSGILPPPEPKQSDSTLHFLFSGTIAEHYGVFDCVEMVDRFHREGCPVKLTIIGYAAQKHVGEKLKAICNEKDYIQLIGIDHLVPHQRIVSAIRSADVGVLAYQENVSISNRIPTKLYEYLANGLTVISTEEVLFPKSLENMVYICKLLSEVELNKINQLHSPSLPQSVLQECLWNKETMTLIEFLK